MGINKKPSAVEERDAKKNRERRLRKIDAAVRRIKALPVLSVASEDEILGYNAEGYFDCPDPEKSPDHKR
jgi:hypothetical protein